MKHLALLLISLAFLTVTTTAQQKKYIASSITTEAKTHFYADEIASNVLVDPGYRVWGLSVFKWSDNKYHGYYSRWPKDKGHNAWMTHCEIAHAVADQPEGPFIYKETVLSSKNSTGWDLINAHNPYVCLANNKICLYYISNDIRQLLTTNKEDATAIDDTWIKNNRPHFRNLQRIGVAIADHPSGPFLRSKNVVAKPEGLIKNITVNPAVIYHDGKYLMILKGDDVNKQKTFRIQVIGQSKFPEGPFTFNKQAVFDQIQTEDACFWYNQISKEFSMVCHVMGKPNLAFFTSKDCNSWQASEQAIFMKKEIKLNDGTIWKPKRVERPFVLTNDKGVPMMIYVAISDNDINGNIAIPIEY